MSLITEEERAARLARAILADIQLYHHDAIAEASPQVNDALAEGRGLFQSRIDPSLYALFDNVLADSALARWRAPRDGTYRAPPPFAAPPPPAPPRANGALLVLIMLAALGAALVSYFAVVSH